MKVKLPSTINDLRLYHLEAIAKIDLEIMDIYDKLVLTNELTGIEMDMLRRISIKDINKIIKHHFELVSNHKKTEPKKEIDIDGKKYCLIDSIGKQPLGWHIDISHTGTEDSAFVASFCYIEKGLNYCEMDKHKNVLNPVVKRAEIFRANMSASDFINIGFFLRKKSVTYNNAYTEIKRQRRKAEKQRKSLDSIGKTI